MSVLTFPDFQQPLTTSIFFVCANVIGIASLAYNVILPLYNRYRMQKASPGAPLGSRSFGLFEFKPKSVEIDPSKPKYHLDIVAIHGFNGDRFETWTNKENGKLWLRDFLPDALPGARVFSFGYDSTVFSRSKGRVPQFASNLLSHLSIKRKLEPERPRSIIFICHSLGGIVCKQALIYANARKKENDEYSDILESTKAIVFFGTPHGGSNYADVAHRVEGLFRAMDPLSIIERLFGSRRPDLISMMKDHSPELQDISRLFVGRTKDIQIISFHEENVMVPLKDLVVPESSATIGVFNEKVIPLPKSHRDMCQFVGEEDHAYQVVLGLCKDGGAPSMEADPARPLKPEEQDCLEALNAIDMDDCRGKLRELHPPWVGTCEWILSDEVYRNWIKDDHLILLCITGHLGIGKSVLMSYLIDNIKHLTDEIIAPRDIENASICYFFCSDDVGRREGQAILRSLLLQIFHQRHDLIRYALARCGKIDPRQWRFSILLDILKDIMLDPIAGNVIFLIDALDECERGAIEQILGISRYIAQQELPTNNRFKILVASKPISEINERLRDRTSLILLDDDPAFKNVERDIKLFVQDHLNNWNSKKPWPAEFRKALEEKILRKAEGNFLWVSLLIQHMKAGRQDKHSLEQIVDDSSDMDGLYRRMLAEIEPENRNFAAKTLRILAGSLRSLTTEELTTALAVSLNDRTLISVDRNSDMDIEKTLIRILGPLIRISNSKVYLVHQDFKKFLYRLSREKVITSNSPEPKRREQYGFTPELANLELATACIAFLNLEDFEGQDIAGEDADMLFELPGAMEDDLWFTDELEIKSPSVEPNSSDLSEDPKNSFYEYAACNWGAHLRASGLLLPQELREAAISLMQQDTASHRKWANVYRQSSQKWEVLPRKLDPLLIAAFFGLIQFATDILDRRTFQLQENSSAQALTWACRLGFADFAEILLAHGTPVTGALVDNRSPLSWACAGSYVDIVKLLLEKADTIEVNSCDGDGRTPISVAVGSGSYAIVKLLKARKDVDLNIVDRDGWSPVFWAIGVKSQEDGKIVADLISDPRVNIGLRDRCGRSILSWAAFMGDCETLKILLESPSRRQEVQNLLNDPGDKNELRTPLSLAAHNGHLGAVKILSHNQLSGPRLAKDMFGKNAFILAADRNYTHIIKALAQEYPGDVDVKDYSERTALSSAIWAGTNNAETVRTFLQLGNNMVDINTKSPSGKTPLMYAAEAGRPDLVRILVEEGGADMTLPDDFDSTMSQGRTLVKEEISRLKKLYPEVGVK